MPRAVTEVARSVASVRVAIRRVHRPMGGMGGPLIGLLGHCPKNCHRSQPYW